MEGVDVGVTDEVIEGVVDWACFLRCAGETIEVVEQANAVDIERKIELPPTAELEDKQKNAPPSEKAGLVNNQILISRIGESLKPIIEFGEEVADRLSEGLGDNQGRPALRRVWRTWVWTRASVS